MSKKVLNVDNITNELQGASLFFKPASIAPNPPPPTNPDPTPDPAPEALPEIAPAPPPPVAATPAIPQVPDDNQPTTTYNEQISKHDSKQAIKLSSKQHDLVRTIRKTVNRVGKEVLFVRLSPEEKHALGSIVYSFNELYRGEGRKTSENEIGRIGLNFLLEDYRVNGVNSILAQVLAALSA
jgi:hypothetical protein